ncbi:MAG TPA: GGDEF domain-containing protein [Herbaspirillum sp.]|nr:GGDEF domain-containing protein [Herbaspirillum sp.]
MNEDIIARLRVCNGLPTLPTIAIKLVELANDPDTNLNQISDCMVFDPALAIKIMRAANSPLYQSRRSPNNVRQAVSLLGLNATIMIALSFSLATSLREQATKSAVDKSLFWRRSILSALSCRILGEKAGLRNPDDLFLAGLLQDIGILVFDTMLPDEYKNVILSSADHDSLIAAERTEFGAGHDELGYHLLKRWNIPDHIALTCLSSHAQPSKVKNVPEIAGCIAVSGYIADVFLDANTSEAVSRAVQAASDWFELDEQGVYEVLDVVSGALKETENLFDIKLLHPLEATAILAEAKEVMNMRQIIRMRELEDAFQYDLLTRAYNRRFFLDALSREFELSNKHDWPLTIMIMDIDHFKVVNDTYGHPVGDAVLISIVQTVLDVIRETDVFARYGGEEFTLFLPGTPLEPALNLLNRLKDRIAGLTHSSPDGRTFNVTVSLGVVERKDTESGFKHPDEMIKAADQALYEAKHGGRNLVVAWTQPISAATPCIH